MTNKAASSDNLVILEDIFTEDLSRITCAFANGEGGRIMVGITPDGNVEGVPPWIAAESVSQNIRSSISPRPTFSLIARRIGERSIIIIDVPTGTERPYVFEDSIYIWNNASYAKANPKEISNMISLRVEESTRWERQPVAGLDYSDLDEREIVETWHSMMERSLPTKISPHSPEDLLDQMKLASSGRLLNSAAVLFSRPDTSLPQSAVKIAYFNTTDRSEFRDSKLITGGMFHIFEEVSAFLERHLPMSSHFEGYKRRDNRQMSPFVIRESVMNALVHRDYSQSNSSVMIALHPDRLEIWNPGRLPDGISPDSIASAQVSRPVNPDIANVAHARGLVEQWGSGTGRIVSECRKSGLRDPKWETVGDGVRLTISLIASSEKRLSNQGGETEDFLNNQQPGQRLTVDDYRHYQPTLSFSEAFQNLEDFVELGYLIKHPQEGSYIRTSRVIAD